MTKTLLQRQRELRNHAKGHGAVRFAGFDGVEYPGNLVQMRKGVCKVVYAVNGQLHATYLDRKDWDRLTIEWGAR
jgi:hypothetical protein